MIKFKGKNSLGSRDLYNSRTLYEGYALNPNSTQPTLNLPGVRNFNKFANMFYGKFSYTDSRILKPSREFLVRSGDYYTFDFVQMALTEMLAEYEKNRYRVEINTDDRYLSNPKVVSGYIDFDTFYSSLMRQTNRLINMSIQAKNLFDKVISFDDYVAIAIESIIQDTPKVPFTKTGLMMSKKVPIEATGLAVRIGDRDSSIDQPKIDDFFRSPNFRFFRDSVIKYGFLIDKDVPWRIVADLGSPQMVKYLKKSAIPYDDQLVGPSSIIGGYEQITLNELESIRDNMVRFYLDFLQQNQYYRRTSMGAYDHHSESVLYRRPPANFENLRRRYSLDYWLSVYTEIRFSESGLNADRGTIDFVKSNAMQLYNLQGLDRAMEYVQEKTFNITGVEGSIMYETKKLNANDLTQDTVNDILEEVQVETLYQKFELY